MDATDLKLLELAGRAAGEQYSDDRNPLERDDLAFRLAVKLGVSIEPYPLYSMPKHSVITKQRRRSDQLRENNPTEMVEQFGTDPYAATRRAIVRAAAALGDSDA